MSAHRSKPFTSDEIVALVEQWTAKGSHASNTVLDAFIDQVGWESMRKLLQMLKTQIAEFEANAADDPEQLGRQAHALRGAAGRPGF